MVRFTTLACLIFTFVLSVDRTFGQTIFEPVRYQFGGQNSYYYGGSDPRVFLDAEMPRSTDGRFGRVNGFAFVAGNVQTHREVSNEPVRVFSDALPGRNAALFGFTPDMARNEANFNQPRYFRMADLYASATLRPDGSRIVQPRTTGPRIFVLTRTTGTGTR